MNVNFNGNNIGNFGMGRIATGAAQEAAPASVGQKASNLQSSSLQPSTLDTIQGSEPVTDVPDAELTRDDDLGKLVNSVFNLPPPPMPAFAN